MLKAGDLARREDHRVKGVKIGNLDEIGGYHMYMYVHFTFICKTNK